MKKAVIYGLVFLLVAALIAYCALRDSGKVEKETSDFATETANAIARNWDPAELVSRAEPGLIKAMASQGQSVEELFAVYAKLGKPQKPVECKYKDSASYGTTEMFTTASYTCEGEFENGQASMLITLRQGNGDRARPTWKVYYIKIASPAFEKPEG